VRVALDIAGLRVRAACGGIGSCGACLIKTASGRFSPLQAAEYLKIPLEQRQQGERLACQLYVLSDAELILDNPAPASNWKSFDVSQWPDSDLKQPHNAGQGYGVAVDIGTTQIRLSLWHLACAKRIANRVGINPQTALGEDVLTRLDAEQQRHGAQSLTEIVRAAIIEGIRDILARDMGEIRSILPQIESLVFVGNTAMLSLLSGCPAHALYDPEQWEQVIVLPTQDFKAWQKSWRMPNSQFLLQAPLAGFIGSDLVADLIALDGMNDNEPFMLADFGTNTEIVLWDGETLWVTSVPGGPAFEGVGLINGMGAESGAVYAVTESEEDYRLHTFNQVAPLGFCATGFIDAIALLRKNGVIKASGRFASADYQGVFCFDSENPKTGLSALSVDAFQRGKAATAAAMSYLMQQAGLAWEQLTVLWLCGSLGRHLNLQNAQNLGLLPAIAPHKIQLFEHLALAGAEKLLLNPDREQKVAAIQMRARVINLSHYPEYEEMFIHHLRL
jgi:uncharacterized 2Fe-2S/4Fe-4S cluster protein (DUF4445 family)